MDYIVVNLKEYLPSVDIAMANFDIEIECAKKSGVLAIKFIHGYGSNGVGGDICKAVRKRVFDYKKQKIIKDYVIGDDFDLANDRCRKLYYTLKDCYKDEDLNHHNPGITIVFI